MSVFDDNNSEANPLETLVGEGKKYASVEELAKAYLHADNHIKNLEGDLKTFREELTGRKTVEELLEEQRRNTQNAQQQQGNNQPPAQAEQPKPLTEEELAERIRKTLQETEHQNRVASNVNAVADKLVELYGDEKKANEVVASKARELGVSTKFLQDVAAQSPAAFFSTLGISSESKPQGSPAPKSDVNTAAFTNTNKTDESKYSWWQAQIKANPQLRFDRTFTVRMHEAATKTGEAFFDT